MSLNQFPDVSLVLTFQPTDQITMGKHFSSYYNDKPFARIKLAIARYEKLGGNLAPGGPEAIQKELKNIRELRKVINENIKFVQDREDNEKISAEIRSMLEAEEARRKSQSLVTKLLTPRISSLVETKISELRAAQRGGFGGAFHKETEATVLQLSHAEKELTQYEALLILSIESAKIRELEREALRERKEIEKEEKEKQKKASEKRQKALAEAHVGKSRQLAQSIKREIAWQLQRFSECPYCLGAMDQAIDADHIYPVIRGGLSTPENMVYVCRGCNSKKSDMTLREFVRKFGYDMTLIEQRLEALNKRF